MAKKVTQYDLLISCPGDIKSEITIIERVVDQFNQRYSDTLGINIRTRHWLKSSYPQSGGKPQELLNQQFVRDCDAAIAIFWTRFGTPTDQYSSGSEEEIEVMLESGKQVFLYFSEKLVSPNDVNMEQYEKVIAFKEKYKKLGLFSSYSSDAEFEKLIFAHLSQYFLTLLKVAELKDKSKPLLNLKTIYNGQICNDAYVEKFHLNDERSFQKMFVDISELFQSIAQNILTPYSKSTSVAMRSGFGAFHKPAEIDEDTKQLIKLVAERLNIDIAEDFFNLGNLTENSMAALSIVGICSTFDGTDNEKKKYDDILKLKDLINEVLNWGPVEKCFVNLQCIKFVLSNDGTTFDEDIDIELEFEPGMLLPHQQLPIPEETSLKYVCEDCSLTDLFGISSMATFIDYYSSLKPLNYPVSSTVQTPIYPFGGKDYGNEYKEKIDEVFQYKYYQSSVTSIVKLHIDYIKQHTAIAFPTPIFVTNNSFDLKYRITSKHNPEIVSGSIKIH